MALPSSFCLTTQIAGPQGAQGAAGTNGTNGVDAFTTLTASFVMPAEGADVTAAVASSAWMAVNQLVYVNNAGYMNVQSKPTVLSVILRNEENTATQAYVGNAPPATAIANGSAISPAGVQGPQGTAGAGAASAAASYWTRTAEASLSNETDMSALATGYLKITTGTGAPTSQVVPIPIADGGTAGITKLAAFNALSPVTTRGDIIVRDATNNVRLALGAAARLLRSDGTDALWAQVNLATDVTGVLPAANGGVGTGAAAWYAKRSATFAVTAGVLTRIQYDAEDFDTAIIYNIGTYQLVIGTTGYYYMVHNVTLSSLTANLVVAIYKNGGMVAQGTGTTTGIATIGSSAMIATVLSATAGDIFEAYVISNTSTTVAVASSYFAGFKIAGI